MAPHRYALFDPADYPAIRALMPGLPDDWREWHRAQVLEQAKAEHDGRAGIFVAVTPADVEACGVETGKPVDTTAFRNWILAQPASRFPHIQTEM